MGKLVVVVGGQYGSEAKGAAAAYFAALYSQPLVIRTGGPNAGHTVVDADGGVHKLRMLPTAAISNPKAVLALAAGAVVAPDLLEKECIQTGRWTIVDSSATILTREHFHQEHDDPDMQWGSTRSGVGAARADRIHRTAEIWGTRTTEFAYAGKVDSMARHELRQEMGTVIVETAQGYGLGLHTKDYPKTTSSDCRAIDALADVGVSPWEHPELELEIWVVVRPYPIRVAGDSGPLFGETSWEALGLEPERTTVTNKVRRVGEWDDYLVIDALRANGGAYPGMRVWLSMADQLQPSIAGKTDIKQLSTEEYRLLDSWAKRIHDCGGQLGMVGTGPASALPWSWRRDGERV